MKKVNLENLENLFELFNEMDNLFKGNNFKTGFSPSIKIKQSADDFIISVVAPGQSKDIFDISTKEGIVTIKAEVKEKNDFFDSFSKSYRLPSNADLNNISAEYKDGILKILISKKKEEASKKVKIK